MLVAVSLMRTLCLLCALFGAWGQSLVKLDTARASSVYSTDAFSAEKALDSGAGYWCSAGSHTSGEAVMWTGALHGRRKILGVKLNWAYAPGEFKVLVSSDGGNFEEASAWRSASRNEVAYTEMVMFDTPRAVKAVTVVMKAPLSWSYFGLNDVRLLSSADESFMIISGATSASGEQCVVASGSELLLEGCLDAIAAGDGRDVFKFQGGQLVHVASALCVSVASGVGGHVGLHDCDMTAKALDGRSLWEATPDSQLRMPRMANYCLNVHGGHATVADCGVAAQDIASGDKFILSSVPELDLGAVARLKSSASLLTAAAARQRKALDQLQGLMPVLPTCKFASMAVNKSQLQKSMSLHYVGESSVKADLMLGDAATAAVSRVYDALKVDVDGSAQLIRESANTLKTVDTQFAKFA